MSRSAWKQNIPLKAKIFKKNIIVWERNKTIGSNLIGLSCSVNSGKIFRRIYITREKVGFKIGSFCKTRIFNKSKKSLRKK
jgi:ribosomal protein S19